MPYLLLILIAVIAIIPLLLKTNAALVFFALCGGAVLVQFANKNISYLNGHLAHLPTSRYLISQPSILIALLFLPAVLTALLSKRAGSLSKLIIQIPPAVATGILSTLLLLPLLTISTQEKIEKGHYWNLMTKYQLLIVFACVGVSLICAILGTYKHGHASKHHH